MALLESIGASFSVGGQSTITNYLVESDTAGEKEVAMEDIDNPDGSLAGRLIFKRLLQRSLSLIALSAAAPTTDFPKGTKAPSTAGTYSGWYVDDASVTLTKSAARVSVKVTSLGI